MRIDIVDFIARCLECQQIKTKHHNLARLLQPLPVPEWKWEVISMDFIIGLSKIRRQNESIMVVVDKISKESHFIPVKYTYKDINIADIFMKEIFILHSVPKIVILDRDAKFMGNFWKALFKGLCIQLNFSTAYHPQTNGKMKKSK